jgi:S-DNA-T family DNA segregation ATPase FtsK/SpoIIIE
MSKTIAKVSAKIAALALSRDKSAKHQCFRIKNLEKHEIVQFIEGWGPVSNSKGLEKVRILVSNSLDGGIPPQYVAAVENTITFYRNNNPDGLIYLESSVQSDEQGLQNIFSLRDSNFLDKSFDEYSDTHSGVPGMLVDAAWSEVDPVNATPILLLSSLVTVIRLIHPDIEPIPIRRCVAFFELACNLWFHHPKHIDEAEANRIIGNALTALELFPDEEWNDGESESRVRRRLEMNSRHADLLDGTVELTGEEVAERANEVRFKNADGSAMTTGDSNKWKDLCSKYGLTPTDDLRGKIPYNIFSQLFVRDTTGLRLGDRIRAEIDSNAPGRIPEFDALDVVSGLNSRNSLEANRLIDAPAPIGLSPLTDLLTNATRKSLEKISTPARRIFFNPAIEIVRLVQRTKVDALLEKVASIEISINEPSLIGSPAHGLFCFLFSETLQKIASELEGVLGSIQLILSGELIEHLEVPELFADRDDSDDDLDEFDWKPLPLKFTLFNEKKKKIAVFEQMEWLPDNVEKFALFWFLAAADDSPVFDSLGTLLVNPPADGEDWMKPLVFRESSLQTLHMDSSQSFDTTSSLLTRLIQLRKDLRKAFVSKGLELDTLNSFLDCWQTLLRNVREQYVPDGVRSDELSAFLATDLLSISGSERRLMMPFHPLRLRWISCYLEQTIKLAQEFLSGEAGFADGDGDYYLDWFENLSPREFPPIAVGGDGVLLYSRSEAGWWEDFSPLSTDTADVSFDSDSITAISNRIISYLDAHPYKRDGLSLLLVLPTTDQMPAEILRRIVNKTTKSLRISLYIAAPKIRWESISRAVESFSGSLETGPRARIFPDHDLAFIDYKTGESLDHLLEKHQLDVAIVTHFLQEQITSQQITEAPIERAGVFQPLRHRSLRLESGSGGSISLVMLPKYPDPMLESWSTITVRANRSKPVAPSQPENTDLVELRINFQDSAKLFKDLHDHCHWVITLERHISREQIESKEAGSPDVLSIQEGIGANKQNTLVVSSRSGRDLIHARLVRKLNRLIPNHQLTASDSLLIPKLASGIYESTRRLAPKLALQALGVSRATEEIVGLTIARNLAIEYFPTILTNGLSAWVSLDEHTDWFGGASQIRADMCRITLAPEKNGLIYVDLMVIEGKLRQLYDSHGEHQVRRTCEFFKNILRSDAESEFSNVDADMWKEQVASAIEALPEEAVEFFQADKTRSQKELMHRMLSDFRSGRVNLRKVEGVYSVCLWDSDSHALERIVDGEITILKSSRTQLIKVLSPLSNLPLGFDAVSSDPVSDESAVKESESPDIKNSASYASANVIRTSSDLQAIVASSIIESSDRQNIESASQSTADVEPGQLELKNKLRGISKQELSRIYENILGCFAAHNVSVFAANDDDQPFIEGPASILFKVIPGSGVDPRKLGEKSAVLKLFLKLEQDQNINFNIDRGFVTIDVPKRNDQRYFVDAVDTWKRWTKPENALGVPIGEDRFGDLVTLNFSSSNSPHLLVAGTTGSGKSEALNTILFGLTQHYAPSELQLILVDPKGTELTPFENSAFLRDPIGWDDQEAIELLKKAVDEMQKRYLLFRQRGKRSLVEYNAEVDKSEKLPWWLVVLDEYADLTHDPQSKKDIEVELKRLAQKARAAGIHIIIATQKPSAEVISTNLRSNLPSQLALRVKSAIESRVVIDEAGAENLNGKGDALLKAEGRITRVQCSRVGANTALRALTDPIS